MCLFISPLFICKVLLFFLKENLFGIYDLENTQKLGPLITCTWPFLDLHTVNFHVVFLKKGTSVATRGPLFPVKESEGSYGISSVLWTPQVPRGLWTISLCRVFEPVLLLTETLHVDWHDSFYKSVDGFVFLIVPYSL